MELLKKKVGAPSAAKAPAAAKAQTAAEAPAKKKAAFSAEVDTSEAAKKIQAVRRGKLARQSTSAKLAIKAENTPAAAPRLSRRVSFSGSGEAGGGPNILEAVRKCLLQLGIEPTCLPDGVKPVPLVATASSDDMQAAALSASKRKEEADAKAAEKAAVALSPQLLEKVQELFKRIDDDGNGTITKEEAMKFWGKNWAKVNAQAMFNEVDQNGEEAITNVKWLEFWKNVVASGYPEDDVLEELDEILSGGSWVDFDDGRTT